MLCLLFEMCLEDANEGSSVVRVGLLFIRGSWLEYSLRLEGMLSMSRSVFHPAAHIDLISFNGECYERL